MVAERIGPRDQGAGRVCSSAVFADLENLRRAVGSADRARNLDLVVVHGSRKPWDFAGLKYNAQGLGIGNFRLQIAVALGDGKKGGDRRAGVRIGEVARVGVGRALVEFDEGWRADVTRLTGAETQIVDGLPNQAVLPG